MKFVEICLQVADEQRRLAGRGYDVFVVRVEGQLDVMRGCRHVVDIQIEEERGDDSNLSQPTLQASTRRRGRLERRLGRPISEVR